MIVQEIMNLKESLKTSLAEGHQFQLIKWRAVKQFQDHWDMANPDFSAMFNRAVNEELFSTICNDRAKHAIPIMKKFIEKHPAKVKQMFHDLFYDRVAIDSRFEFFNLDCDEILKEMQHEVGFHYNNHFNDDFRVISVYLVLKYPNKYSFYQYDTYAQFLSAVKAKGDPEPRDYDRYFKLHQTIFKMISKDEDLMETLNSQLDDDCYDGENILLSGEYIHFENNLAS